MQTHDLKRKTPNYKAAQVGRGGKRGKTSGRGTKGQDSRSGHKKRPELRDFIKRIPKLRGQGKSGALNSFVPRAVPVPLSALEKNFKAGDRVEPKSLLKKGLIEMINGNFPRVKILGDGEVTIKLVISGVEVSASAKAKLEKAGGTVHA
ncbi:uL15 family ribosomal protein [Candidatus Parcubacteria bacterium]|nr:uL15 family ribosomal protein [Candidatus Parcubacteria bacterium]